MTERRTNNVIEDVLLASNSNTKYSIVLNCARHKFNPLTHGRFSDPHFKVLWEGGKTKFLDFFFIGASATKRFARSRIFRHGCLMIILSKGKKKGKVGRTAPPPPWFKGLTISGKLDKSHFTWYTYSTKPQWAFADHHPTFRFERNLPLKFFSFDFENLTPPTSQVILTFLYCSTE